MDQQFFLAANSGQGFYSLYDGFPAEPQFLHIIKGGPGTGKSGFMKAIRRAVQERGMDTVSILCSGDPDSLDGLSVPALGQAWVDGTAPHVREPKLFGVDADYVNLGHLCRLPLDVRDRERARALNRAYKERYKAAYQKLAAAASLEKAEELHDAAVMQEEIERLREILDALPEHMDESAHRKHDLDYKSEKRFISAISCRGELRLDETVNLLCKQNYYFRGGSAVLAQAAAWAEQKAEYVICCPRPLRPGQLEAVLLPEQGIGFHRTPAPLAVPLGERASSRAALQEGIEELREAKALHDKLESVYKGYMDFDALTAYTDEYVENLFR